MKYTVVACKSHGLIILDKFKIQVKEHSLTIIADP